MPITAITSAFPTMPTMPTVTAGAAPAAPTGFGDAVAGALGDLHKTQSVADDLAVKAMTGDVTDVHDYMIAATKASLATEVTVAVRNKAVDAFNAIMNMQV